MGAAREVNQRDVRLPSKEIMDAIEHGESLTVTRDGRPIGELVPLCKGKRYLTRAEFPRGSQLTPSVDITGFRADQDAAFDAALSDPYAR